MTMGTRHALTTVDNPFDPIDDFDQWLVWDRQEGYDTPNLLGRIAIYSNDLPLNLVDESVSDAIDEILEEHGTELYRKVSRDYPDPVYVEAV
jgi:hypothetical protein